MTQLLSSAQSNPVLFAASLFVLIIILREIFIAQSASQPVIYYTFLFPGIIVHELSHVVLCLVTFTRIKSIKLFSRTGGFVLHQKPRFALITFLISIAPLLGGMAILYFSLKSLGVNITDFNATLSAKFFVILYFLSSILLTMLPSKQDIINALSGYLAIGVGVGAYFIISRNFTPFNTINTLLMSCFVILIFLNFMILIVNKIWK